MTKSRLAPALALLGLAAAPAAAQEPIALSADDAVRLEQAMHRKGDTGCGAEASDGIVICGRRVAGHGQRMEFAREPGEIVRHINEPGSGLAAFAADRCTRLCNVGVRVNLIEAVGAVPKIVRHILGKE